MQILHGAKICPAADILARHIPYLHKVSQFLSIKRVYPGAKAASLLYTLLVERLFRKRLKIVIFLAKVFRSSSKVMIYKYKLIMVCLLLN